MRIGYLTGSSVRLRPLVEDDKECALAWFDSQFPINATRAAAFFEEIPSFWWDQSTITLVIERVDDDQVVGGLSLTNTSRRTTSIQFHMAPALPEADVLRADALRIVIPWLRDEHEYMVVRLNVGADEEETVAAAESLGMKLGVRLREFIARPGGRADRLCYEALNPRWEVQGA